MTAVWSGQAAV